MAYTFGGHIKKLYYDNGVITVSISSYLFEKSLNFCLYVDNVLYSVTSVSTIDSRISVPFDWNRIMFLFVHRNEHIPVLHPHHWYFAPKGIYFVASYGGNESGAGIITNNGDIVYASKVTSFFRCLDDTLFVVPIRNQSMDPINRSVIFVGLDGNGNISYVSEYHDESQQQVPVSKRIQSPMFDLAGCLIIPPDFIPLSKTNVNIPFVLSTLYFVECDSSDVDKIFVDFNGTRNQFDIDFAAFSQGNNQRPSISINYSEEYADIELSNCNRAAILGKNVGVNCPIFTIEQTHRVTSSSELVISPMYDFQNINADTLMPYVPFLAKITLPRPKTISIVDVTIDDRDVGVRLTAVFDRKFTGYASWMCGASLLKRTYVNDSYTTSIFLTNEYTDTTIDIVLERNDLFPYGAWKSIKLSSLANVQYGLGWVGIT